MRNQFHYILFLNIHQSLIIILKITSNWFLTIISLKYFFIFKLILKNQFMHNFSNLILIIFKRI
jgi:hypothetical protein